MCLVRSPLAVWAAPAAVGVGAVTRSPGCRGIGQPQAGAGCRLVTMAGCPHDRIVRQAILDRAPHADGVGARFAGRWRVRSRMR